MPPRSPLYALYFLFPVVRGDSSPRRAFHSHLMGIITWAFRVTTRATRLGVTRPSRPHPVGIQQCTSHAHSMGFVWASHGMPWLSHDHRTGHPASIVRVGFRWISRGHLVGKFVGIQRGIVRIPRDTVRIQWAPDDYLQFSPRGHPTGTPMPIAGEIFLTSLVNQQRRTQRCFKFQAAA